MVVPPDSARSCGLVCLRLLDRWVTLFLEDCFLHYAEIRSDAVAHEPHPGVCFLRLAILNPSGVGLNAASSPSGGSW